MAPQKSNSERDNMDTTETLEERLKIIRKGLNTGFRSIKKKGKDLADVFTFSEWIAYYLNGTEDSKAYRLPNSFKMKKTKLKQSPKLFAPTIIELLSKEENRGYVFFLGSKKNEMPHEVSRYLVEKAYKQAARQVIKYFIDLEQDVSGFYWKNLV